MAQIIAITIYIRLGYSYKECCNDNAITFLVVALMIWIVLYMVYENLHSIDNNIKKFFLIPYLNEISEKFKIIVDKNDLNVAYIPMNNLNIFWIR